MYEYQELYVEDSSVDRVAIDGKIDGKIDGEKSARSSTDYVERIVFERVRDRVNRMLSTHTKKYEMTIQRIEAESSSLLHLARERLLEITRERDDLRLENSALRVQGEETTNVVLHNDEHQHESDDIRDRVLKRLSEENEKLRHEVERERSKRLRLALLCETYESRLTSALLPREGARQAERMPRSTTATWDRHDTSRTANHDANRLRRSVFGGRQARVPSSPYDRGTLPR